MRRRGQLQPFKLLAITAGPLQVQKVPRRGGHRPLDPKNLERDLSRDAAENARRAIREASRKNGTWMDELGDPAVLLDIDALEPCFEWDPGDFSLLEEQPGSRGDS
jgi:hypothetical protein